MNKYIMLFFCLVFSALQAFASMEAEFANSVIKGDLEQAKYIYDSGQVDINHRYVGSPYLFLAAYYKQNTVALYLLEKGADPNIKTIDGGSSLFYAVKHGQTVLVKKMLEANPNMNIARHRMFFRLPLKTTAKRNGYTEIYEMLVKYDKNYKINKQATKSQ